MSDKYFDELLTYKAAAQVLRVPIGTLYGLVSKRQIPHIRINKRIVRFSQGELQAFIEARRIPHEVAPGHSLSGSSGR